MIRKVQAFVLFFILLLSTIGFSFQLHLCQGHVVSFSILGEAEACMKMDNDGNCGAPIHKEGFNKTPCCQNLQFLCNTEDNQRVDSIRWFGVSELLVIQPAIKTITLGRIQVDWISFQEHPPPPDIPVDLYIVHETFLI